MAAAEQEGYPWPRGQETEAVVLCGHCDVANEIVFISAVPGDDPLDESRVFNCKSCGKWSQVLSEDGVHRAEALARKPAAKGTSGQRPLSGGGFETNRRGH